MDKITYARTWMNTQYPTRAEMLGCITECWLTADGQNCYADQLENFNELTDEALAAALVEDWPDDNFTAGDIAPHIAAYREKFMKEGDDDAAA
jgi:hypothetical protein